MEPIPRGRDPGVLPKPGPVELTWAETEDAAQTNVNPIRLTHPGFVMASDSRVKNPSPVMISE